MIKINALLILILSMVLLGRAYAQDPELELATNAAGEDPSKWILTTSIDHFEPLDRTLSNQSMLTGDLIYLAAPGHVLRAIQPVSKLYDIEQGQDEIQPNDTLLFHFWTIHRFGKGRPVLNLRTGATVPVSEQSRRLGVRSRTSLRLTIAQTMANGKFVLAARPYFNYQFNEFKQSPDGDPLNLYTYGYSIRGDIRATSKLTLIGIVSQGLNKRQPTQFGGSSQSEGVFSIDGLANYMWRSNVAFRLGITQSGPQVLAGRVQVGPFEERQTQVYSGIDYTF